MVTVMALVFGTLQSWSHYPLTLQQYSRPLGDWPWQNAAEHGKLEQVIGVRRAPPEVVH
jgi:hypothetical protein